MLYLNLYLAHLLKEYFYGDYGKIGLILGSSFIEEDQTEVGFSDFTYDSIDHNDTTIYKIKDLNKLSAQNFKSIYE